jgi:triacylglycerol lipase
MLVQASKTAYCNPPTIFGKHTDTQVIIHDVGDMVIVAFRGSKEIEDWLTDFDVDRVAFPVGAVHHGFSRAIRDIFDSLKSALQDPFARPVRPALYITGHSLGGALAVLAAFLLTQDGFDVQGVYTFGQPRVGDSLFCAAYDRQLGDRTFRIVNQADIVPRVPGLLLGYRHAGQKYFISPFHKKLELNPKFWALASADLFDISRDWVTQRQIALLADHRIDRYIAELKNL